MQFLKMKQYVFLQRSNISDAQYVLLHFKNNKNYKNDKAYITTWYSSQNILSEFSHEETNQTKQDYSTFYKTTVLDASR